MNIKLCIIGGGSKLWAITLMKDLSADKELKGNINLYDINQKAAEANAELSKRIFGKDGSEPSFIVKAYESAEEALTGVDFVVISVEPGPIESRKIDLVLPEEYGILQSVGDTTGPGGFSRALRSIPIFRHYARLIKKVCPEAWIINYTNPMTLCTSALHREEPELKILGCCHEVFGTQKFIAEQIPEWLSAEVPHHKEIELDICGVNHFTFAVNAQWKGINLNPYIKKMAEKNRHVDHTENAKKHLEKQEWFDSDHLIAQDFLTSLGTLGAAGDRHLAEFVPWYLQSDEELQQFGVIRTPYSWRVSNDIKKHSKEWTDQELEPEASDEEGVTIMKALMGGEPLYTNVNVPNRGQIPWLPESHIVESNALITSNSIMPSLAGTPSSAVKSLISRVATVQQLILDGVFNNDEDTLFQAFLTDPLMTLSVQKAEELFKKILEENRKYIN